MHKLTMHAVTHAPLFVALLLLLVTALALNTSRHRLRLKVFFGDGGDERLRWAIRAHGNAVEHALPLSVLLVLLEMQGAAKAWIVALGVASLVVRGARALGFLAGERTTGMIGIAGTYLLEMLLCVWVLVLGLRAIS